MKYKTFTAFIDKNGTIFTKFELYSRFITENAAESLEDFNKSLQKMLKDDTIQLLDERNI